MQDLLSDVKKESKDLAQEFGEAGGYSELVVTTEAKSSESLRTGTALRIAMTEVQRATEALEAERSLSPACSLPTLQRRLDLLIAPQRTKDKVCIEEQLRSSEAADKRAEYRRRSRASEDWGNSLRSSPLITQSSSTTARPVLGALHSTRSSTLAGPEDLAAFRELLLRHADNYAHAWRYLLDTEVHGKVTIREFGKACRNLACRIGNRALFKALDSAGRNVITLLDLDMSTGVQLLRFYQTLREFCDGDMDHALAYLDVNGTRRITRGDFIDAVLALDLAAPEEAPRLFDMLCFDNTWSTSSAITASEVEWLVTIGEQIELALHHSPPTEEVLEALQMSSWVPPAKFEDHAAEDCRNPGCPLHLCNTKLLPDNLPKFSPAMSRTRVDPTKVLKTATRGRWVSNRLFHDAAWREQVRTHRTDEYYGMLQGQKNVKEVNRDRLFERLYREAEFKRLRKEWIEQLEAEPTGERHVADPDVIARLSEPRQQQPEPEPLVTGVRRAPNPMWYDQAYGEHFQKLRKIKSCARLRKWENLTEQVVERAVEQRRAMFADPHRFERLYQDAANMLKRHEQQVEVIQQAELAEIQALQWKYAQRALDPMRIRKLYNDGERIAEKHKIQAQVKEIEEQRTLEMLSVHRRPVGEHMQATHSRLQAHEGSYWSAECYDVDGIGDDFEVDEYDELVTPAVRRLRGEPEPYAYPPFQLGPMAGRLDVSANPQEEDLAAYSSGGERTDDSSPKVKVQFSQH